MLQRRNQEGTALVEFALILFPTLGFFFLLLNFAWVLFAWSCVQESVREGVRAAVTCTPSTGLNSAIQQVVTQYSFGFVNSSNISSVLQITYLTPSLGAVSGPVTTGDVVKVSVKNVKVSSVPALLIPTQGSAASWSSPLYVGAVSADVMACATPATP